MPRTNFLRNKRPGPIDSPQRPISTPRHDNDILVGEYYYGIDCPHCKQTTPIVELASDSMIGARIDSYHVDKEYDYSKVRTQELGQKLTANARGTFGKGGIEATPTFIWSDGLRARGAPTTDEGFAPLETAYYVTIRAAKCYVKQIYPNVSSDEVHSMVVDDFFGSHLGERDNPDGTESKDPYNVLREITRRI